MAKAARAELQAELERQGLAVAGWRAVPVNPTPGEDRASPAGHRQPLINSPAGMPEVFRTPSVRRPPPRQPAHPGPRSGLLRTVAIESADQLQGVGDAGQPAGVLSRPRRRAAGILDLPVPSALFHQYPARSGGWRNRSAIPITAKSTPSATATGPRPYTFSATAARHGRNRPLVNMTGSDSSSLDNMLEVLVMGGMDFVSRHAPADPTGLANVEHMDPVARLPNYNSMHLEPWDGPAGIVLTDGRYAGCVLDRNGLRPARYVITGDRHHHRLGNRRVRLRARTGGGQGADEAGECGGRCGNWPAAHAGRHR